MGAGEAGDLGGGAHAARPVGPGGLDFGAVIGTGYLEPAGPVVRRACAPEAELRGEGAGDDVEPVGEDLGHDGEELVGLGP